MSIDEAFQAIQDSIGCACRVEIVPKCIDGAIVYRAVVQDEFGVIIGDGASMAEAVVSLAGTLEARPSPDA